MNLRFVKILALLFLGLLFAPTRVLATDNQTDILSPIQVNGNLPFQITIEAANFQLPVGLHSGAVGLYKGLWIFIAGRLNGMHGFGTDPFPIAFQNRSIYVVDPSRGLVYSRSLDDPSSGLTQDQIDSLSVTSPESYQEGNTLYLTGGYGLNTGSAAFETKPILTALYLPGIVNWVTQPGNRQYSVAQNIKQIYNSAFQVTGGRIYKLGNLTQLVFGQNFTGVYSPGTSGNYAQQIQPFQIKSVNGQMSVDLYTPVPSIQDSNYRRRDMNIVPTLLTKNKLLQYGLVAYSGVFTPAGGVWTVPVVIDSSGNPAMADPTASSTFKQGMSHYACATASLYSNQYSNMYHVFLGGMSYLTYQGGVFVPDPEIPFTNQVTTVQMDQQGNFTQYLMNNQYPTILSTTVNPGNILLFGAGAYFIPAPGIAHYANGIISLDKIRQATVIGYIVGGIASTVPNTSTQADSFASTYVFKVILTPQ